MSFFAVAVFLLTACNGGIDQNKIAGEWKLTQLSKADESVDLKDCDKQTTWNFTTEAADPLGDGTEVQHIKVEAPADCKHFGFDSEWMTKDGKLFISSIRIGGMGGVSLAGIFDIVELNDQKLVLRSNKYKLALEK